MAKGALHVPVSFGCVHACSWLCACLQFVWTREPLLVMVASGSTCPCHCGTKQLHSLQSLPAEAYYTKHVYVSLCLSVKPLSPMPLLCCYLLHAKAAVTSICNVAGAQQLVKFDMYQQQIRLMMNIGLYSQASRTSQPHAPTFA